MKNRDRFIFILCASFICLMIIVLSFVLVDWAYLYNEDNERHVARADTPYINRDVSFPNYMLENSIAKSYSTYIFGSFGDVAISSINSDIDVSLSIYNPNSLNLTFLGANFAWERTYDSVFLGNDIFGTYSFTYNIDNAYAIYDFGAFLIRANNALPFYLFNIVIDFSYFDGSDSVDLHISFGSTTLYNYLVGSYNDNYNAGYNEGNIAGIEEGYENGYEDGYAEGYEDGYDVGLEDGSTNGYQIGYEDGYAVGYNDGLDVFVAELKQTKSLYEIYQTNQIIPSNSGAEFDFLGMGFYSTENIYQTLELRLYFWLGNDLSLNFDLNLDIVNYLDTLTQVNLYLSTYAPMQNVGLHKLQEYQYDPNLTIEENNIALSEKFSLDGFSTRNMNFVMLQFVYDWAFPIDTNIVTMSGSLSVYDSYATLIDNYRNEIEAIYDNEIRYDSASYIAGVENGTQRGYEVGYSDGLIDGSGGINFGEFFFSIIDAPIQAVLNLFNFEIFGYNMRSFFLAVFSICLVVVVIRLILRMRS